MHMATLPPGLQGQLREVISGCYPESKDRPWMAFDRTKLFTNVFIWNEKSGKILLGYKKRGFGMGLYNGFGGKVEPGETVAEAALRELNEEAGVGAHLASCGTLLFYSEGYPYAHMIELFSSEECDGDPIETDEMRPEWFAIPPDYCTSSPSKDGEQALPPIPLDKMWPDDRFWMPLMLSRRPFSGRVDFARVEASGEPAASGEAKMVKWWFGTVE